MRVRFLFPALLLAAPLAAQAPVREIPLGAANATHPFQFSLLRGVRELANGTLLAAAPLDDVLLRLDLATRKADTLGHHGRGPGEYIQPDGVWPIPGDSTLLVDLGNNRLSVIDPRGKILGNTMSILSGGGPRGPTMIMPSGMDRRGAIWFRENNPGDTTWVSRFDRATKQTTRMAALKAAAMKRTESGPTNNRRQSSTSIPWAPADGWAVAPSGLLYLVRVSDYHVEVVPSQGAKRVGAAVPFTPVKIGTAEKTEYADGAARGGGLSVSIENRNGEQSVAMSRGKNRPNPDDTEIPWPAAKPPFDPGQLWVDAKERLWVRRHQPAGRPALYDVFNDQGARIASVRLPADRTIVGMGAHSVYVVSVDADDMQQLERYALPL